MVGLAETAERDRHEGEAATFALPKPSASPSPCTKARSPSEACPLKSLSSNRRRLFHLLQRQLVLQLAASSKGGDIDPRRRPPHVATPQGILIRWLTAEPKRLEGSYLLQGLHERGGKFPRGDSEASRNRVLSALNGKKARHKSSTASLGGSAKVSACKTALETAPGAAISAKLPLSNTSLEGECPSDLGGAKASAHADHRPCEAAGDNEGRESETVSSEGPAAAGEANAGLIKCVICLTLFKPVCGGLLCTPCLLRLGSTHAALEPLPVAACSKRDLTSEFARGEQFNEENSKGEGPPLPVGLATQEQADRKMPKRRRVKRSASLGAHEQQHCQKNHQETKQETEKQQHLQHQQPPHEPSGAAGAERCRDDVGWRARATADAAASAARSSWWGPYETAGEAPVVPPLLLPLLPSIFSLHARPWPPPPAKRRRFISRRRRGLGCFAVASSWEETLSASSNSEEGATTVQESSTRAAAAETPAQASTAGSQSTQSVGAARGAKAEGDAKPGAALTGETATTQETVTTASEVEGARTPGSSTSCISAVHHSVVASGKADRTPSRGSCCSVIGPAAADNSKSCLCYSPTESPLAYVPEALPRRRRGRMSEPAQSSSSAAADASSESAPVREIAAAAAAVASLKTEAQHTPPSRLRRISCGPDIGHSVRAAAAATGPAAATMRASAPAALAEGNCAVCLDSSVQPKMGQICKAPAGAATTAPAPAKAGAAAEVATAAAAAASATEERSGSSPCTSSSQECASGAPLGSLPPPPARHGSLARISQGLIVGPSSLGRGSGLGVYSCKDFSRRALVCEYSGVLIDRNTALLLRSMSCASHVINVQMQHLYLLGFHTPCPLLGGGAFVNDGRWRTGGSEGPGVSVRFRVMFDRYRAAQRVMIVAMKDIKKGEELLTSYENDYWRLQAQPTHGKRR